MEEKHTIHKISEEAGICKLIREVCTEAKNKKTLGADEINIPALFNERIKRRSTEAPQVVSWINLQDTSVFIDAARQVDTFLLAPEVRKRLKELLEDVQEAHDQLVYSLKGGVLFPAKEPAVFYRNKYSELLQELFPLARAFEDFGESGTDFLLDILNVDISFEDGSMCASLWCPVAVDAVLHIYECIEMYINTDVPTVQEEEGKKLLESNYQAVIISRALRRFRWIITYGGELLQAAVPAALPLYEDESDTDREKRIWSLDIPVRKLSDYNSYEGIGELRLFDKIVYELDRRKIFDKSEFYVLIVGDILKKPIEVLCQTVEQWLMSQRVCKERDWNNTHIYMTVLTRNKWENIDDTPQIAINATPHVSYNWKLYNGQLMHGKMLDELIISNDWMFILDSCDLYNGIYAEGKEPDEVRRQASTGYYTIAEQQQMLYALAVAGCFGVFTKESNHTFIQYLGERLKKFSSEMKTAYVYVSDLDAIDGMDFCDEHFIRVEHYNDKGFLIVRMPGMDEASLMEQTARRIIVLNLWQVIKHCTVRNIDCFLKYFSLTDIPTAINIFRNTLIGVGYEQWRDQLNFYYYVPDDLKKRVPDSYESKLKTWINIGIMPYFREQPRNMFYDYFVKAFGSFLYSDAKCVDDMLFLHLFVDKHQLLEKTVFLGVDEDLLEYQAKACKYSQKQFYATVMEDYDTSSEMFMYKYRKLDLMERADVDLRRTIFQKVKGACERNQYEDSYLKINCEKMI